MKKLLFILLALPMLWGCEENSEGKAQQESAPNQQESLTKAEKIFAEVMAEAGNYDATLAEGMLADKEWRENTYARYNDDWSEVIATGMVDGVYPPDPPGVEIDPVSYTFQLSSDGDAYWYEYPDCAWSFDAENRTLIFTNKRDDRLVDIYRIVALSDEWLILENDQEHTRLLFEGHAIQLMQD